MNRYIPVRRNPIHHTGIHADFTEVVDAVDFGVVCSQLVSASTLLDVLSSRACHTSAQSASRF